MKDPMQNIDDYFYKEIRDHYEYPDENIWNNLEVELDKDVAMAYQRKYQKVKRRANVLLVLLVGFVLYEVTNQYFENGPSGSKPIRNSSDSGPSYDRQLLSLLTAYSDKTIPPDSSDRNDAGHSIVVGTSDLAANKPGDRSIDKLLSDHAPTLVLNNAAWTYEPGETNSRVEPTNENEGPTSAKPFIEFSYPAMRWKD